MKNPIDYFLAIKLRERSSMSMSFSKLYWYYEYNVKEVQTSFGVFKLFYYSLNNQMYLTPFPDIIFIDNGKEIDYNTIKKDPESFQLKDRQKKYWFCSLDYGLTEQNKKEIYQNLEIDKIEEYLKSLVHEYFLHMPEKHEFDIHRLYDVFRMEWTRFSDKDIIQDKQ